MANFILLRHAKSGIDGVYYGQNDVDLQEAGKEQEIEVKKNLQACCLQAVISSPLKRCLGLAQDISEQQDCRLYLRKGLVEIDIGEWEGKTFAEAANIYQEIGRKLLDCSADIIFPGGESLSEFRKRVAAEWLQLQKDFSASEVNVLVVGHAGCIRAILAYELKQSAKQFWENKIDNCSTTVIRSLAGGNQVVAVGVGAEELPLLVK